MIKRISFVTGDASWLRGALEAPSQVRPIRIAVCTLLSDVPGADLPYDAIGLEWFTDLEHLARFDAVSSGRVLHKDAGAVVVVAAELVLRGADWLEQRWRDGGEKLKHMAIGRRAAGLTPAEFSERWRNHAGTVQRPGADVVVIPDEARGRAYVQNHPIPLPLGDGEWAYDAINEVYFDDLDGLRTRIEWFDENRVGSADDGLIGQSWLVAVREEVVF